MKFHKLVVTLVVTALIFPSAPAFAWDYQDCINVQFDHPDCKKYETPGPKTPPPAVTVPVAASPTAYGGQAFGGYGSAEAAAAAFQKMNNAQRQEFKANVNTQDWTSIQTVLSLGAEATIRDNVIGGGQGGAGGSVHDNTFGGGNGAGNTTSVMYQSFNRSLSLASALSPEARGDVKMGEWSKCGPRYVMPKDKDGKELPFETFDNKGHVATIGGVAWKNIPVQTIVGPLPPFDVKEPVREVKYNLGSAMTAQLGATEGYFLYGHKMMLVAGVVAHSGASNIAGQGGSQGNTLGLGNSGGGGIPQVGAVIAECQLDAGVIKAVEKADKKPAGATTGAVAPQPPVPPALDQVKDKVVTGFKPVIVDDKPGMCGGKPLPPGKRCSYQAVYGEAVSDVKARNNITVGTQK